MKEGEGRPRDLVGHSAAGIVSFDLFKLAATSFAAVITDQTMPKLNGSEVAMRLREVRADVPVIVMTGNDATTAARLVDGIPGVRLLLKPVDVASLDAAVNEVLPPA